MTTTDQLMPADRKASAFTLLVPHFERDLRGVFDIPAAPTVPEGRLRRAGVPARVPAA